jgi:hypothetical protein
VAFLDTLNRTVLQLHILAVADIPIRAFLEYISYLVVAGSCHIPPLTNPFHTPVVPHHYTTAYPQFKRGTAPKKANVFAEIHVRKRVLRPGANLIPNPGGGNREATAQFSTVNEFVPSRTWFIR